MNKLLRAPIIASLIVIAFGITFHQVNYSYHEWGKVALWLPVYISPIWGMAGLSYMSERRKK